MWNIIGCRSRLPKHSIIKESTEWNKGQAQQAGELLYSNFWAKWEYLERNNNTWNWIILIITS